MKKFKMFIASVICLAMFSGMALAQAKGNIGFGFGTSFHKHQQSMLKTAGMNYFRLYLKAEEGVQYFLHNESGSFMVDEGDVDANGRKNAEAIGMSMDLGLFNLDVLVGSATVKIKEGKVPGSGQYGTRIAPHGLNSTDPFAELAIRYSYVKSNASLDLNFAYRYHTLKKDIEIETYDNNDDREVESINDLSSINLSVGISYMF
jgi:hypothetical protein